MKTVQMLEWDAAVACEQAGFPLEELPDHPCGVQVDYRDRPLGIGREGYLPHELFELTQYDLTNPDRAWQKMRGRWIDNIHARSVLNVTLESRGTDLITHIGVEALFLAKGQHRANVAFTAARIGLEGMTGGRETVFAVWDDGEQYATPEALEARFRKDGYRDLSTGFAQFKPDPASVQSSGITISTTIPVVSAVEGFGGTLTVVSGENRLDISKQADEPYDFRHQKVSPIEGNVMLARVPYTKKPVITR